MAFQVLHRINIGIARSRNRWLVSMVAIGLLLLFAFFSQAGTTVSAAWSSSYDSVIDSLSRVFVVDAPVTQGLSAPTPAPNAVEVTFEDSDLAALQRDLAFDLWLPATLPSEAKLVSVHKVNNPTEGVGAELRYEWSEGAITVYQSQPSTPVHLYVDPGRLVQRVVINDNSGVYYDPGGPLGMDGGLFQRILQWTDGARWFEMRGTVSLEELLQVASSLAP